MKDFINQIIAGNAIDVLKQLPDNYIDLTVTSPPYDNLRDYHGYVFDFEGIAKELYRITKIGGVVVWVVGDSTIDGSETGTSFRQALYFKGLGFNLHDTMIYMKSGPNYPSKNKYYQIFEYMFIFSKGKVKTFNPLKDRENRWFGDKWSKVRTRRSVAGILKRTERSADEGEKYGTRFNIWQYAVGAGNGGDKISFEHLATFPEDMAKDHILSWSNPNDLVLDPMCGSGTTLKQCKNLKRRFIGIDISPEYCKISEKRLAQIEQPLF